MESVITSVNNCLKDTSLYVGAEKWFQLLQDPGVDVTQDQRDAIDGKKKG